MTTEHDLLSRALPFLRDEAAKYEDDGSNEPLELAREIADHLERAKARETTEHETVGDVLAEMRDRGRKVRDARGTLWALISIWADRIERAHARESAAQVGVPEGWSIRADGDEIRITAPNGVPGGITLTPKDLEETEWDDLPAHLLYALGTALLSAAPAPAAEPEPKPADDGEALAYLIDWPGRPDLGHYFSSWQVDGARSRPLYAHHSPEPPPAEPVTSGVELAAEAIEYHGAKGPLNCLFAAFSAMDNNDTDLGEWPQRAVDALACAGWAVVPCSLPFEVLGNAAIAGVFETGNPKHGWDYLVSMTRITPDVPISPQPAPSDAPASPQAAQGDASLARQVAADDAAWALAKLAVECGAEDCATDGQPQTWALGIEAFTELARRLSLPARQKTAQGGVEALAEGNRELFRAIRAAVEDACPRWGEAHDNPRLHKIDRREREWIASLVFAAVAGRISRAQPATAKPAAEPAQFSKSFGEELARRLSIAQPNSSATLTGSAEFKAGDRVEWDSGCGKLAATIRGYSLDIDDSGFVDCVPASSLTRLSGGSHD